MPIKTVLNRDTGASYIIQQCACGDAIAPFGDGLNLIRAHQAFDSGEIELAKELLGDAYCLKCWREKNN